MSTSMRLVLAAGVICVAASPALALNETFDTPVTTGSSQAPGVWYTDRYAPAGFTSPDFFDGDNRLLQQISAADGASSRAPAFSGAFYNTQGRKFDLESGTKMLSIELYVDSSWATTNRRMAGLWGTGVDGANGVTLFPIVEFTSDNSTPRFQAYNNGVWEDLGLPTGFGYDSWYTLSIALSGGNVTMSVGDSSVTVANNGTVSLSNIILQGHNTTAGVSYDIHWDNLTSAVPEPGTWAMMIGGFALVGAAMRRKKIAVAYA